jgi:hypothetical protein
MANKRALGAVAVTVYGAIAWVVGCGGDDDELAGSSCESADECYQDVEGIRGAVQCLDRTAVGYCTHACSTDADCCAADGECPSGRKQVCAPFESTGEMLCFLSCEGSDVGDQDATEYCQEFANADFGCRSTGGGKDNRQVCFPN